MAGKKRCFSTVRALKRFDEKLLCATLAQFPEYLHRRGLVLPNPPDRERMDYEAIRDGEALAGWNEDDFTDPPDVDAGG